MANSWYRWSYGQRVPPPKISWKVWNLKNLKINYFPSNEVSDGASFVASWVLRLKRSPWTKRFVVRVWVHEEKTRYTVFITSPRCEKGINDVSGLEVIASHLVIPNINSKKRWYLRWHLCSSRIQNVTTLTAYFSIELPCRL